LTGFCGDDKNYFLNSLIQENSAFYIYGAAVIVYTKSRIDFDQLDVILMSINWNFVKLS